MHFLKLKKTFHDVAYNEGDRFRSYGFELNGKIHGIEYLRLEDIDKRPFLSVIPERYYKDFYLTLMKINAIVPPHTDSNILATINFYIRTDNCLTQFYSFNTDKIESFKLSTQTTGSIFARHCLDDEDSFIADPYDIYLLDVSKPHSVSSVSNSKVERLAFCLQTMVHNFDAVKMMLEETDSL